MLNLVSHPDTPGTFIPNNSKLEIIQTSINRVNGNHIMKCYSTIGRNEMLPHVITWRNLIIAYIYLKKIRHKEAALQGSIYTQQRWPHYLNSPVQNENGEHCS